ncbi:MAG: hypothetical protein U1E73_09000 [Planctomycetota bacterium]
MKHLLVAAALTAAVSAQTIQPPFNGAYVYTNLGSAAGVGTPYGGCVFKAGNPNVLVLGGGANGGSGAIYEVTVARDPQGFITGFVGTATQVSTAAFIDGGLCYGPNNVLFFTTYNNNTLGQIKPGSTVPDKVINLANFGVTGSTGTCNFAPANFPGAGELKIASYSGGGFYGFTIAPDGTGTFDITPANGPTQINGGPEGILYVPPGSALIPDYTSILVNEYSTGSVVLYSLDAQGNPVPASRTMFMTGLSGAEGSCIDPITGDLVFVTFGGGDRVVRVTGFGVCGSNVPYGTGIAGLNGVPAIDGGGCAGRGQITTIDVTGGRPFAPGLLAVGFAPANIPVFNGALLVGIVNQFFHQLDATGAWNLTILLPVSPAWNGLNIYSQSWYIDPAATFGVSATAGLHTLVR